MDGWGNYIFAWVLLLTLPLWSSGLKRDMLACQEFRPLPPGVSPCATEDQLHRARLERFHKQQEAV